MVVSPYHWWDVMGPCRTLFNIRSFPHSISIATTTTTAAMSKQRANASRETTRREAHQGKRNAQPHQQQAGAMDVNVSHPPILRARVTEANAPGLRRSPDVAQMATDVIEIASQILPDWEIDVTTNLPLHMHQCCDCVLFLRHVKENLQGGVLSLYLERQKKHW